MDTSYGVHSEPWARRVAPHHMSRLLDLHVIEPNPGEITETRRKIDKDT